MSKLVALAIGLGLASAMVGCGNPCESARDVLIDKCDMKESQFDEEAVSDCGEADEAFADCVNDNSDKTCLEIGEACTG